MSSQLQLHNHQLLDGHTLSEGESWDCMFKQQVEWREKNGIHFTVMLQATADYIRVQGHGWVPSSTPESPKLGTWVKKMRFMNRRGKISASQTLALESIGFLWEEPQYLTSFGEAKFAEMLQAAAEYVRVQGHGWVPSRIPEYPQLGIWASNIRKKKRRGKISTSDTLALENIGFLWKDPHSQSTPLNDDAKFVEMLQTAAEYIQVQGHGWVPSTAEFPKLGQWAQTQRSQKRTGKLSASRQLALDNIGFVWEAPQSISFNDAKFAEMLQAAAEYIQVQGHGWVPSRIPEYSKLGQWAQTQRSQKRTGKLSASRQLALDNIGFIWEAPASNSFNYSNFEVMLQTTAEYIRVQGHGWVPERTPECPKLGTWAKYQRCRKRAGKLPTSRRLALDSIGFIWEVGNRW